MSENEEYIQTEDNASIILEDESNTSVLRYEDSNEHGLSQVSIEEETILSESQSTNPKILIQRVFHQPEKHVVEQKLDYVIANSQEEITKHVYGGLFRNKYYKYAPDSYCKKHAPDLFEHKDETLVKLGDKFDSQESFRLYVDGNAKRWKYYLKCADSHRKNGKETFVFKCVFAKQRSKFSSAKGLRKRTFAVPKGDCPCRVILKPVPYDAKDFTVIYVCNHHDHPLTDEYFYKLQHGRRIHPSIKAELMDLLALEVDREVVKKYFESLTGYSMSFTFFQNMLNKMKKDKIERQFSLEKLKEMSKKIEKIKEELGMNDEEENVDNDLISDDNLKKDKVTQVAEVFNVLKTVSAPKKTPHKMRARRSNQEIGLGPTPIRKRPKKQEAMTEEPPMPSPHVVNNKSRLETRLQELKHDRETLQSIKHLQDSVRCETAVNAWAREDVVDPAARTPPGGKVKRAKYAQKQSPITKPLEMEPQAIVIENAPHEVAYVENQDIIYENEVTVMETTEENYPETVVNCVNVLDTGEIALNENNVSYCIQYDDGQHDEGQPEQQFVLMLDDVESFENLPEVHIQATEFATVSIVSENHQKDTTDASNITEYDPSNKEEDNVNDSLVQYNVAEAEQNQAIENSHHEIPQDIPENTVFEVIQTNDRKIFPSKEIVQTVILKKTPKPIRKSNVQNSSLSNVKMKHHTPRKSKNTDVISQYFKEKSERFMADLFKDDMDNLGEDECYMIFVDDREENSETASQDWMEDFDEYDAQNKSKEIRSPKNKCEYADSTDIEDIKSQNSIKLENTNEVINEIAVSDQNNIITESIHFELPVTNEIEIPNDADLQLEKRLQGEKELLELEQAIGILKRQKLALVKDVEHLIATKDDLIEDITKAARLSRRLNK